MINFKLLPQYYSSYSFRDLFYSLRNIKKENDHSHISKFLNNSEIYFTNYARTSLRLALSSLNLKKGAKVGVQAFTCHTVFEAIVKADMEPVFIDIDKTFTLDFKDLKKKVSKIEVLIVTHTFGIPSCMQEIQLLCKDKIIIEDCAHSLFSYYNEKPVGTFGDMSVFSFGYGKYPSIGPGGFISINNKKYKRNFDVEFEKLHSPSLKNEIFNIIKNLLWSILFQKNIYGLFTYPFGKQLDNKLNLTGKQSFTETKGYKSNVNLFLLFFDIYKNTFSKKQTQNGIYLYKYLYKKSKLKKPNNIQVKNYFIFPVLSLNRDLIIEKFVSCGIESGKYFSSSLEWAQNYGYQAGFCPNTEMLVEMLYTIPCYFSLNKKDLDKIIKTVEENPELFKPA